MTQAHDDIFHGVPFALLDRATGGTPHLTAGGGGGGGQVDLGQYLGLSSLLHRQATPDRNCARPQVQPIADKRGIPPALTVAPLVGGGNALLPVFGCFHLAKLGPAH